MECILLQETIVHDLVGAEREKPVLFVGLVPYLSGSPIRPHGVAGRTSLGGAFFNTTRTISSYPHPEMHTPHLYFFFNMHGFPVNPPESYDINDVIIRISDMENWPADGYIQ